MNWCSRILKMTLLANLFLHYALDTWLTRHHPETVFERYAESIKICGVFLRSHRLTLSVLQCGIPTME
ncbi:hypothetical protein [Photorhabdus sp. CRCIA-P01]|uniref:hypothetical protein n=1 Tax=Photorhabdus sp. CRCIA-P01 TaxID=2019570 RepID=UPI0013009DEA|nr:hypothetical protein [Photorhabdus sp. CRCIA-P01]